MTSATSAFGFVLFLLSTPVVQGQDGWSVTYDSTEICATEGSTVEISCTYRHPVPTYYRVVDTFWLTEVDQYQRVELRKASVFAGRLQESCRGNICSLRISDVRQSDADVYYFRFITNQPGGRFTGSPGVTLSVTGLQVKQGGSRNQLQCHSSCRLPDGSSYIWYKNGGKLTQTQQQISPSISGADSFSCALSGREDFPSASVCVSGEACNRVIYSDRSICAFKGSSVNISCTYNSYGPVSSRFWFRPDRSGQSPSQPEDLGADSQFTGRVEVIEAEGGRSTLRITELTERDSGQYRFTFRAGGFEWGSSLAGTTLTVTDIQVKKLNGESKLQCQTKCHMLEDSSYVWYKSGQRIDGETSASYVVGSYDFINSFSCSLKGHEDFPSESICVYGHYCNRVTYSHRSVCVPKNSSVDISCEYNSYDYGSSTHVTKKWFRPDRSGQWWSPSQPEDLGADSQSTGRVKVIETEGGRSTLRITELTERDSGQYRFTFRAGGFEWGSSLAGTTLTVTALQVQVITATVQDSSTEAELRCLSSCSSAARLSYVWFKNGQKVTEEDDSYRDSFSPGDAVACALKGRENYKSASVYAPELPSVSVSPSGEIVEGSSVTLTCSTDANPAANYTWYQTDSHPESIHEGPQLVFSSIQSSDFGQFYCTAENQLGRRRSESVSVDVQHGPTSVNISVSPSGEIVEGSSVTLTCSTDANPAANYTWFKEDEESPTASGQSFTITDVRAEHSGKYSCDAWNSRGRRSSTVHLTVAGKLKSVVTGITSAVFLAVILLSAVILMRKKRIWKRSSKPGETQNNSEQRVVAQVREEEQDGLQYTSVRFCRKQADPVYSNFSPAELSTHQEDTEYATVRFSSTDRIQEPLEDVTALYSTVVKAN